MVQRLVDALHPLSIYLFGSRAEGRARPDSDFDLVVVLDDDASNSDADYDEVYAPLLDMDIGCVRECRGSVLVHRFMSESTSATSPRPSGHPR